MNCWSSLYVSEFWSVVGHALEDGDFAQPDCSSISNIMLCTKQ